MKYTFTTEDNKEKTINVPDDYIARNKKALNLSTMECIQMYLSDEGYISNDVVRELTEKAQGQKKKRAPRKEDPIKRELISMLFSALSNFSLLDKENVNVVNPERIISFSLGEDKYEVTLSKKRK